jgi:Mrp family chromosome partitioning ATPase
MRESYNYIIIDTPPVLAVPDSRVIGQFVDAVVYTVLWNFTTQRQVVNGIKSLENVGVRISGLVLSQINPKGLKKYRLGEAYGAYGGAYYDS